MDTVGDLSAHLGRALRELRTQQDRSLGDLARAAGLSKTILSRIESGEGNPSIDTLWRLARALDVPLTSLLEDPGAARVKVVRHRAGTPLDGERGMRGWLVHAEGRPHRSELFELELATGVEQRNDGHRPGTEELVLCTRGRLLVGPLGEEVELGAGDTAWFAADGPHRYRGLRDARAVNWVLSLR